GSPTSPTPTGRLPQLPRASMLPNGVIERTSYTVIHLGTTPTRASITTKFSRLPSPLDGDSSGDRSGENLVVKRARVGVVPRWVTEQEVLSTTPLGSIEARGNDGRRPVSVRPVGLPLCRNKSVRVGWADVGGAKAWASYYSIGTQSGQYLSSDPEWWGLTKIANDRLWVCFRQILDERWLQARALLVGAVKASGSSITRIWKMSSLPSIVGFVITVRDPRSSSSDPGARGVALLPGARWKMHRIGRTCSVCFAI
ncbi:hypothetical protein ACLOJK_014763, partial [Asimina triloba]